MPKRTTENMSWLTRVTVDGLYTHRPTGVDQSNEVDSKPVTAK
jgi:hypothetical protein